MTGAELFIVLFAMIGGAIRVSTPFMFVALGETLTEKSGRINLGLEGNLVLGAMVAYAVSFHTGSPWLGVLAAGGAGVFLGLIHGAICSLPRVNDIAVGIAMMTFGIGVAFFFGVCIDVHQGALLGQHAFAYTLLSFFAITVHRRLLWFTVGSQALQIPGSRRCGSRPW
jgi:ABC-type uncharacterized transport system permease subunit